MTRFQLAALLIVAVSAFTESPHAGEQSGFLRAALKTVDEVVVPGWEVFGEAAEGQHEAVQALCMKPSAEALARARSSFGGLVSAFGGIEFARFGPAIDDYRFEKIFFWPDRRGRGLKQTQSLIAAEDRSAVDPERLSGKSVAVQGLPALEYLLFGKGSDSLEGDTGSHRCKFAAAVSANLIRLGKVVLDGWRGPDGHRALMAAPGEGNPVYRDESEVLRTLLDAAREQLQLTLNAKLERPLGDSPASARPKRAPFWRSGNSLRLVATNLESIRLLFSDDRLDGLRSETEDHDAGGIELLIKELQLELGNASRAVQDAITATSANAPFQDSEAWDALRYATSPVSGALSILSTRYPASLGLIVGFNALDGD